MSVTEKIKIDIENEDALKKTAKGFQDVGTSAEDARRKTKKFGDDVDNATRKTEASVRSGRNAVLQFSRIVQDARYGIIGIQNNLEAFGEAFVHLKDRTGSSGAAIKLLISQLKGPAGLLVAIPLVISAVTLLGSALYKTFQQGRISVESFRSALDEVLQLRFETESFEVTADSIEEGLKKLPPIIDGIKKRIDEINVAASAREPIRFTRQEENELTALQEELAKLQKRYEELQGAQVLVPILRSQPGVTEVVEEEGGGMTDKQRAQAFLRLIEERRRAREEERQQQQRASEEAIKQAQAEAAQRERLLDVMRKVSEAVEQTTAFTDKQRKLLADVFRLQEQITQLKEVEAVLGKAAVAPSLTAAEEALSKARARLAVETAFVEKVREAAAAFGAMIPRAREGELTLLNDRLAKGLKLTDKQTDAWNRLEQQVAATNDEWRFSWDVLRDIADTVHGIGRLVDVFGDLSEEVRGMVDGLTDALGAAADFRQLRDEGATGIELAPSVLGVATGIASFAGTFLQMQKAEREAMKELTRSLRELNASIREEMDAAFRGGVIGGSLTQAQITQAGMLISEILGLGGRPGQRREDLYAQLAASGLPGFSSITAFRDTLNDLLLSTFGGRVLTNQERKDLIDRFLFGDQDAEAALAALGVAIPPGIRDFRSFLIDLRGGLGQFTDDVAGATERLRFLADFLGLEGQDALDAFLDALSGSGISKELLGQLRGVDLTTDAGRARLQEIIAAIASAIAAGTFDFGGLTPDEITSLLDTLKTFAEGEAFTAAEDATNQTVQVQRAITEVQANAVIRLLEVIAFWAQRTAEALTGTYVPTVPVPAPPAATAPVTPGAFTPAPSRVGVTIGQVSVNGAFGSLDEIAAVAGRALEERIRRQGYSYNRLR